MSNFQPKDNSGALFDNAEKQGNQPDRRGECVIGGVKYWVSSWNKTAKSGRPYMSLAFTPADQTREQYSNQPPAERPMPAPRQPEQPADNQDQLPF